jgi:hypothetical protein
VRRRRVRITRHNTRFVERRPRFTAGQRSNPRDRHAVSPPAERYGLGRLPTCVIIRRPRPPEKGGQRRRRTQNPGKHCSSAWGSKGPHIRLRATTGKATGELGLSERSSSVGRTRLSSKTSNLLCNCRCKRALTAHVVLTPPPSASRPPLLLPSTRDMTL